MDEIPQTIYSGTYQGREIKVPVPTPPEFRVDTWDSSQPDPVLIVTYTLVGKKDEHLFVTFSETHEVAIEFRPAWVYSREDQRV